MQVVPFNHPAWIEIDVQQFVANLQIIRKYIGSQVKLCLPVKANAYGHGILEIARYAAPYIDYLGVSCLQEGVLLREHGIKTPILVFGALHLEQIPQLIANDLEVTISSRYKAKAVAEECAKINTIVKVHLEIDTGMQRTGVKVATAYELLDFILSEPNLELSGVYSHLATADDLELGFAQVQINQFKQFVVHTKPRVKDSVVFHLANSSGFANYVDAHFDMIRPGILAYGYTSHSLPMGLQEIRPCLSIYAKVSYYKRVTSGHGISYGHSYVVKKDSNIITVPIGYGDGLRRCLSNKGSVLLHGKRYPMVGNICMDQFMVDLGDDPGYVGEVVTIIGNSGRENITINEMADQVNTISYEILCGFNDRLPRIYINEPIYNKTEKSHALIAEDN